MLLKLIAGVVLCILVGGSALRAQDAIAPRRPGELSAQQSLDFTQAKQDFSQGKWDAALPVLKDLHQHHPKNAEVAKYAAEAAMNIGDNAYAETALQAVVAADANDWQALALMARCDAQEGKAAERDAALAQLVKMHANTTDVQFQKLTQFLVERDALKDGGRMELYYALVPWSRYNIYEMARIYGADGKQTLRVTLETDDFDQPTWAKAHPKEAAAGARMFSMDGYKDQPATNGQTTQTHFTFRFFDARPDYKTTHDLMMQVAEGGLKASSSTSGIPVK